MARENDELEELELEDEGEILDPDKQEVKNQEEDEDEDLEIVTDPLYEKNNWEKDPAELIEDEADKELGKRVQKRIGKLKASASEINRQKLQKEQELAEAVRFAQIQQKRIIELEAANAAGGVTVLERQVEAEERSAQLAKSEYLQAMRSGEPDKIVEAQDKLTKASVAASVAKTALDERKASKPAVAAPAAAAQPQRQQQQAVSQVSQKTMGWIQKNAWFNPSGGDELSDYAIRVHNKLVEMGRADESDNYFSTIDKSLRNKFPERFGVKQEKSPVTPAARTATQRANGAGPAKLKLTSSQVAYAKSIGLDTKEKLVRYAQEVAALEKGEK